MSLMACRSHRNTSQTSCQPSRTSTRKHTLKWLPQSLNASRPGLSAPAAFLLLSRQRCNCWSGQSDKILVTPHRLCGSGLHPKDQQAKRGSWHDRMGCAGTWRRRRMLRMTRTRAGRGWRRMRPSVRRRRPSQGFMRARQRLSPLPTMPTRWADNDSSTSTHLQAAHIRCLVVECFPYGTWSEMGLATPPIKSAGPHC